MSHYQGMTKEALTEERSAQLDIWRDPNTRGGGVGRAGRRISLIDKELKRRKHRDKTDAVGPNGQVSKCNLTAYCRRAIFHEGDCTQP
jgi:hypothetical protein